MKYIVLSITILIAILWIYTSFQFPGILMYFHNQPWLTKQIEYPCLSLPQCKTIKSQLKNLNKHRKTVNSVLQYIGSPTYILGHANSFKMNTTLIKEFSNIYGIIQQKLSEYTGKPCKYQCDLLSIPGFHIFNGDSVLSNGWNVASIHVDLQYERIKLFNKDFDKSKTLSFTIPICLPSNDCGLWIFDKKHGDVSAPFNISMLGVRAEKIIYKPGKLYLHNGHNFHMISSFYGDGTDRITIQGHAIYNKKLKEYWIYW